MSNETCDMMNAAALDFAEYAESNGLPVTRVEMAELDEDGDQYCDADIEGDFWSAGVREARGGVLYLLVNADRGPLSIYKRFDSMSLALEALLKLDGSSIAKHKLPAGVTDADFVYPTAGHDYDSDFELWYTERFGWCIPTLLIGKRRGADTRRTYAVRVSTGELVRIGQGPHVLETLKVYGRKTKSKAMKALLDIKAKGEVKAHDTRDRISTRRARGRRYWY